MLSSKSKHPSILPSISSPSNTSFYLLDSNTEEKQTCRSEKPKLAFGKKKKKKNISAITENQTEEVNVSQWLSLSTPETRRKYSFIYHLRPSKQRLPQHSFPPFITFYLEENFHTLKVRNTLKTAYKMIVRASNCWKCRLKTTHQRLEV